MNKLIPSWLAALSGILTGRSLNKCGWQSGVALIVGKTMQTTWRDVVIGGDGPTCWSNFARLPNSSVGFLSQMHYI
jgi:hypothetical protein